jgi:hypothetical protein
MKKIFLLMIVVVVSGIPACKKASQEEKKKDFDAEKKAISLVLEKYRIAHESEDLSLVRKVWASDSDIIVIGTSGDEMFRGWDEINEALKKQFDEQDETFITVREEDIKVNAEGNTAWFSEILAYNYIANGKATSLEGLRFTGVLEKRDSIWLIVQSHISVPAKAE